MLYCIVILFPDCKHKIRGLNPEVPKKVHAFIFKIEACFGGSRGTYSSWIDVMLPSSAGSVPVSLLFSRLRKVRSSVVRHTGKLPVKALSDRSLHQGRFSCYVADPDLDMQKR